MEYNGYVVKWEIDQTSVHNRAKSISITNQQTGKITSYVSVRAAQRATGVYNETLKKYANSEQPYKGLIISNVK